MEASGPPGDPLDEVFGECAQRLEARVLAPLFENGARLAFSPAALDEAETRELAKRAQELQISEPPHGGLGKDEEWARALCGKTLLEDWATSPTALRYLARAYANATAPLPAARIMGILNVTPDSFSDGGTFLDQRQAIDQGLKLIDEGADILDIGGESTRPGARPVDAEEELRRVLPIIEHLQGKVPLSIDTQKARVAERALATGAEMVNDVSAGSDPSMFGVIHEAGASVCLMHMQGTPETMQRKPAYQDCVREVTAFLRERAGSALKAGIPGTKIVLDPGIGFGKRQEDNVKLIRAIPELRSLGQSLCLGVSRKSILGTLSGEPQASQRDPETTAAVSLSASLGASLHRVHNVVSARKALAVTCAVMGSPMPDGVELEREDTR